MNAPEELLAAARGNTMGDFLSAAVEAGFCKVGEIFFAREGEGFRVCHWEERETAGLMVFHDPHEAMGIAAVDGAGNYRPLKTAPNLRRGWELKLATLHELRLALDLLYPAALGNWRALVAGAELSAPLEHTLGRQTGMYRVTAKLDGDGARAIADKLCRAGCLRRILWTVEGKPIPCGREVEGFEIPLLCTDACSLFLGEARRVVKAGGLR
jgi:sirohydrochlorin cobaltochelatase